MSNHGIETAGEETPLLQTDISSAEPGLQERRQSGSNADGPEAGSRDGAARNGPARGGVANDHPRDDDLDGDTPSSARSPRSMFPIIVTTVTVWLQLCFLSAFLFHTTHLDRSGDPGTVNNSTGTISTSDDAAEKIHVMDPLCLAAIGILLPSLNYVFSETEFCNRIFPFIASFAGTSFAQFHVSSVEEGVAATIVGAGVCQSLRTEQSTNTLAIIAVTKSKKAKNQVDCITRRQKKIGEKVKSIVTNMETEVENLKKEVFEALEEEKNESTDTRQGEMGPDRGGGGSSSSSGDRSGGGGGGGSTTRIVSYHS